MSNTDDRFKNVQQLVSDRLTEVNSSIASWLNSDIVLINSLAQHIIQSGGKRLRPLLLLLVARTFGYSGKDDITLAAVIEFIHTATLLHDDVVDESSKRRGKSTANEVWGNAASVLVGDFLYSRAFEMMITCNNMQVMQTLARTTNEIAQGEVQQLLNAHSAYVSEADYYKTIEKKTAILFAAATRLGVIIHPKHTAQHADIMQHYGMHLGTAFQLVDDVLDYTSDNVTLGKNVGDDLADGKPTLPLIYAMVHANDSQKKLLDDAITNGNRDAFDSVIEIIQLTGGIDYTRECAFKARDNAISQLQKLSPEYDVAPLIDVANYAVERIH